MKHLHLRSDTLDLIRRLDGNQDGRIDAADVGAALAAGWLHAEGGLSPAEFRRLLRLRRRPGSLLQVALGRRRLHGMRDWTWAARRLKNGMAAAAGLPPVLLDLGSARVGHGDDPGNYYCEHVFFTLQQAAVGSSVQRDPSGDLLVGFLHVPGDGFCRHAGPPVSQDARHAATRQVVAAALRGFADVLDPAIEPTILITGFGPFRRIVSNPTGDFVSHGENLDAAMALAFGPALRESGEVLDPGRDRHLARRYRVAGPDGRDRAFALHAVCLPVADEAIAQDGGASVPHLLATLRPHAVLAMGVNSKAPLGDYRVEHHADDGHLRQGRHVRGAAPTCSLSANFALARAIHRGAVVIAAQRGE